jgi:hypothetical protein
MSEEKEHERRDFLQKWGRVYFIDIHCKLASSRFRAT